MAAKISETFSPQSGEEGDERPEMIPKNFGTKEGHKRKGN
jgi:hypothetical protein